MTANLNLATLTLMQGFYINGTLNSGSGTSVAGAGDVNNDGYDDIIIGAPWASSNAGEFYVVYGSASINDINLATLTSVQGFSISGLSGDYYANPAAGAGDVNNDGYADFIINAGISYVIYGKDFPEDIDLSILTSAQGFSISASNFYISSVAGAGDVNNDGYDDVIIGAPNANNYAGASYVIYGGTLLKNIDVTSSLTSVQGFSISGSSTDIYFGYSVSGLEMSIKTDMTILL
ncbi:MAG: hypothetical protein WBJ81_00255 [Rickettsiales bacterium]